MRLPLILLAAAAFAQQPAPRPPDLTAADLEVFLDGLVPATIQREDIAGLVIAVVKDGQVLLAKGYGYGDVAKKIPVTPDATLFRPGSISKLFTWTAVMQQVEAGKLDLDTDINTYLDFAIASRFAKPVTLRHLLTHTPGFEEAIKELFVKDVKSLRPLRDYLIAHQPARVFPPGSTPAYSNYGTALAGYIVERVSGMKFEDYIDRRILEPLGMTRSTFRQPVPDAMKDLPQAGYNLGSDAAKPFEVVQAFPAGSMSVTAMDMTHFMRAHLNYGEYNGRRILSESAAKQMYARQAGWPDTLDAMALGFYETSRNGLRILSHGGDTAWFHSDLHLIHEKNLGFFMSQNSRGRGQTNVRGLIWESVLDRYFPYAPPPAPVAATAKADAALAAGRYLSSRSGFESLFRVTNLAGQTEVKANADGTIETGAKGRNGKPKKYEEIGPLLYREVGGQDRIAFTRDAAGRLRLAPGFAAFTLLKAGPFEDQRLWFVIGGFSLAVFAFALAAWPLGAWIRRHYGRPLALSAESRRWRLIALLAAAANLACLGIFATLFAGAVDPSLFSPALDGRIRLAQAFGWLGVLGMIAAHWGMIRRFADREANWMGRLAAVGMAVALAGFSLTVWYWNLLSFSLKY
jgi:CubicO group peptidase (beta-lactamase class C family)